MDFLSTMLSQPQVGVLGLRPLISVLAPQTQVLFLELRAPFNPLGFTVYA